MNTNDFLFWEQNSRDTIDFKTIYVDVAGDIITGLLLSQIIYWNLPSKEGKTKLRVTIDGELWLAKGRSDWYSECRISEKQFDRSIKILQNKGIVTTKLKKFNGAPMKHIKLNVDILISEINKINSEGKMEFPQRVKSNLPKGQNGLYPKGKMDFNQKVNSLTENTAENITENTTTTDAVVDSNIISNISKTIEDKTGFKINPKSLSYLYNLKGEDKILEYANNWSKFSTVDKKNAQGFFVKAIENEYQVPKQEEVYSNINNFEQRQYQKDEYEKYYYKVEV